MDYENEIDYENETIPNDESVELIKYEGDCNNNISQIFSVLSIICAVLGIFAILSYPLIHIIKTFCNIDKFIQTLPIGYLASVKIPDMPFLEFLTMVIFGILCFMLAVKLYKWLTNGYTIASRITCFISGIVFMYFMISKEANALLIMGLESISMIVTMIVTFVLMIPLMVFLFYYTPIQCMLPEPNNFAKNYYGKLFSLIFRK